MIVSGLNLPPEIQTQAWKTFLSTPTPNLIMQMAAEEYMMESRNGKTIRFSRNNRLPTSPVQLSQDGAPVPATPVVRIDIDATMGFFGQYIAINQRVILQNQDPVLINFSALLGLSMRMTEDQLTRDTLAASATVYRFTGGNNGDIPTNLSLPDIDTISTMLDGADAHMILDSIEGEARIGTGPVRNAYVALCHSDLNKDLNALNGFESRWNYANPTASPMKSERGAVNNVRFFTSSVATVRPFASALGRSVYDIYFQGMESLGVIRQDNFSSQLLFRGPEFSDALFQNVTYGWTTALVSAILNDQWLTNGQVTL